MNKVYQRINWQNEPSISTPLNETNLNKIDYALDVVDGRVVTFDTTKANQSDLLQTVKTVAYNTTTGVFTFTFWNGNTVTADLNIEKIPVDFSMDEYGVITMTTADGTTYTCDISELIKLYTFNDSSEIDFTTTTDVSGNKTITASIVSGSITGDKLQPNYLADCVSAKTGAETAETNAGQSAIDSEMSSEDSEAWAVGERNGQPVPSTDPAYQNNAKWWAQHGTGSSFAGLSDTNFTNLQNGQIAKYDSTTQMWVNTEDEGGLLPHFKITSEAGSTVTVVCPDTSVIVPTQTSSGIWQCDVPAYGVYTVHAVINGDDAVRTVTVDTVKEYVIHDEHYSYTLNVYAPTGSSILVTDGDDETYTGTGAGSTAVVFALHQASTTYTIEVTYDGLERDMTITSSATTGGSGSKTIEFGTINLTLDEDLIGETVVMTNGTDTKSKVADSTSMVFYPNATGNWRISVDYEGETVYAEPDPIVVSSLSTPVSAELSLVKIPEGATVLPTDDIQTWLACANITNKSYTTLAEVLADRETFETLLRDSNACDYMARSTTWADDVADDADAITLIGKYDYCSNALLDNATWAEAIANSDYTFIEPLVPTMTGTTTPSGEIVENNPNDSTQYRALSAFDNNSSSFYSPKNDGQLNEYIGYIFDNDVTISKLSMDVASGVASTTYPFTVQTYDGTNWNDADEWSVSSSTTRTTFNHTGSYKNIKGIRIISKTVTLSQAGVQYIMMYALQFYGRASSNVSNTNGIIHTAMGNDSVYCVETGDTYTATDGIATVDFSQFDEGVYTFGSTTAKDPTNLSNDYTKQFKITKSPYGGTTELYLMPDAVKTLYWWGYENGVEDISNANGWTNPQSSQTYLVPTHNQTYIYTKSTGSAGSSLTISGESSVNKLSFNESHVIVDGKVKTSGECGRLRTFTDKNFSTIQTTVSVANTGLQKVDMATVSSNVYLTYLSAAGAESWIYALWYE